MFSLYHNSKIENYVVNHCQVAFLTDLIKICPQPPILPNFRPSFCPPVVTTSKEYKRMSPEENVSIYSPAYKISDNIGVTDKYFITRILLLYICSMNIFSKSSFNPSTILVKLLKYKFIYTTVSKIYIYLYNCI